MTSVSGRRLGAVMTEPNQRRVRPFFGGWGVPVQLLRFPDPRARGLRGQRGIAASEKDERVSPSDAGLDVTHPADHDLMVAAGQAVLHRAL